MNNNWKADPAKYKRLAKPFEDEEHARVALSAFMVEVVALREKYRVPELVVQFQVYIKTPEGEFSVSGGAGYGDQAKQATMMKRAFDQEFASLCYIVEALAASMPKLRRELLTQPNAEDLLDPEKSKGIGVEPL